MAAKEGSLKNSAAAIWPPAAFVNASTFRASVGVQTPPASRVPALIAKLVTIRAFTAREKSITPRHCWRVSTPPNPAGGFVGAASSASWK